MSEQARLRVNGEDLLYRPESFPKTVQDLVNALGIDAKMVVAEVNGDIVRRERFAAQNLADGDKVELVRFVGGG